MQGYQGMRSVSGTERLACMLNEASPNVDRTQEMRLLLALDVVSPGHAGGHYQSNPVQSACSWFVNIRGRNLGEKPTREQPRLYRAHRPQTSHDPTPSSERGRGTIFYRDT